MLVANSSESERTAFITANIFAFSDRDSSFVGLEAALIQASHWSESRRFLSGRWTWLLVLGGFIAVSWIAQSSCSKSTSRTMQYMGLGLYVVAEAVVMLPMMALATRIDPNIPLNAGLITLIVFLD